MKRQLFILLSLVISSQTSAQNFDTLIEYFDHNRFGIGVIPLDSIDENSLYKTDEFEVSISKNPIDFVIDTFVIENPYNTDDWHDYYITFPKSFSVLYEDNLISLFDNGKFICHNLIDYQRNPLLEESLNTKKFNYHWLIDNTLYASTKSILFGGLFKWTGGKWQKAEIRIPVKEQSILFSDQDFIVYSKCSGEFGGTIYFYDRKNNETFFTESTCSNTITKKKGQYYVLAHLGHGMGFSEIKIIENPRKLSKASKKQLWNTSENLGYKDETNAFLQPLDLYRIQLFSTFYVEDRKIFLVHLNEYTFLAEMDGTEIQIVNPLFNNDIYTHHPITKTYEEYTLINMDFYGIALDREVSVMIIKDQKINVLFWNKNHSR